FQCRAGPTAEPAVSVIGIAVAADERADRGSGAGEYRQPGDPTIGRAFDADAKRGTAADGRGAGVWRVQIPGSAPSFRAAAESAGGHRGSAGPPPATVQR